MNGNQLIVKDEPLLYGQNLKEALESRGFRRILAGTVMVAKFSKDVSYLFEIGDTFEVKDLKDTTFMYPIYGSRLPLNMLPPSVTPDMIRAKTTTFRNCRLPSTFEYKKYLSAITV